MYLLCIVLIVIVSVLMCGIVLIQNSKGGGLASSFASSNQIMGVRKTTDFLEKATWTLAIAIALLSILATHTLPSRVEMGHDSVLMENAVNSESLNPETLPDFNAGETSGN
ncbi:MAG: preprotein translocase subunit SecG [Bacteroidaceae bacterium]|jgi:preprotein translocase subunit SecG|nr:preprotein translocase subunit SecG [Bacteroidaceae bacterium]